MKDVLNMSERELNNECAKFMGLYDDPAITYVIPEYSKSLDLMHEVEKKIKQKGYEYMYAGILSNIIGDCTEPRQFDLIHASPTDRIKALLTVLDEEKRTTETHELVHVSECGEDKSKENCCNCPYYKSLGYDNDFKDYSVCDLVRVSIEEIGKILDRLKHTQNDKRHPLQVPFVILCIRAISVLAPDFH